MSINGNLDCVEHILLLKRIFEKLYEDVFEALHRTPDTISSKPYIERALRLIQSGLYIVGEIQKCVTSSS